MTFYDWLQTYQDHQESLPLVSKEVTVSGVVEGGDVHLHDNVRQRPIHHEGSFSTTLLIRCNGSRVEIDANPSRFNRIDNLYGFDSLDDCYSVYNKVLTQLGLPKFTKCTKVWYLDSRSGELSEPIYDEAFDIQGFPRLEYSKGGLTHTKVSNGAVIKRIDITANKLVGEGNVDCYLESLSTQRYRNSLPRLHHNGKTVEWLSKNNNANLIYPSVYDKAYELQTRTLPKVLAKYGFGSPEHKHLLKVIEYCIAGGLARFEQKLRQRQLNKMDCRFWGLADESKFFELHQSFLDVDSKLRVTNMTLEGISEQLMSELGLTTRSANTTAFYAHEWMQGKRFDLNKRQVKEHRARLNKIGIDIGTPCNIKHFSPVKIVSQKEIRPIVANCPDWYQLPVATGGHLQAVI